MDRKYGCAVLAGGKGRRMGQLNKAELVYDGQTFLKHICSEFEKAGLKGYISTANYEQEIPAGWTVVHDSVTGAEGEYIGPIGGIYSCLVQAERDGLDGLFFAPCDAPYFSTKVMYALDRATSEKAGAMGDSGTPQIPDAAVIRTADGRLQTTFGWYSIRSIPYLETAIGNGKYRLTDVLDTMKTCVIASSDAEVEDSILSNINYLSDYECIKAEY